MNAALSLVAFAAFGLIPIGSQLLAIIFHRTNHLARLKKWLGWLRRLFPLFIVFDLFAQNEERVTVAFRWGYNLKKKGVTVESGRVPDASEINSFLEFETFKNPAVVESIASFLVNAIETTHDFDELELTLLSKARPPIPSKVTGWFPHDAFMRAPFRELVVLTYSVDS